MNKHVALVKKYLADPTSVSLKEIQDNARSATDACLSDNCVSVELLDACHVARAAVNAANPAFYVNYATETMEDWIKKYNKGGLK